MRKTLRFAHNLVPLILSGKKVSTWRLWDDKNLSLGDTIDFMEFDTDHVFASAQITKIIEKPMGLLTQEDRAGHETFESDEEMYNTYSRYYDRPVNKKTLVKIIWFKLMK